LILAVQRLNPQYRLAYCAKIRHGSGLFSDNTRQQSSTSFNTSAPKADKSIC